MEDILLFPKSDISADRKIRTNFISNHLSDEKAVYDPFIENLIAEGGESFLYYLRGLGVANGTNMMVLSSRHNNYYDYNDLKGIKTLINLRKFNRMRHLNSFLSIVSRMASPETSFIGCFSGSSKLNTTGMLKMNGRRIINYSDSGTYIQFDKYDIIQLLESHSFKVYDMTKIKGLTYFMARLNGR